MVSKLVQINAQILHAQNLTDVLRSIVKIFLILLLLFIKNRSVFSTMAKHADCDDSVRDIDQNPTCTCKVMDFHRECP